jgi:hypothetical protein
MEHHYNIPETVLSLFPATAQNQQWRGWTLAIDFFGILRALWHGRGWSGNGIRASTCGISV